MKTFFYSLFFTIIIVLGIYGLLTRVFTNPAALFIQLLIIALVVLIGLFLFKKLTGGTGNSDQMQYRKAARQSRKRHKMPAFNRRLHTTHTSRLKVVSSGGKLLKDQGFSSHKEKAHSHLTVIEGKKNKKRNRLLF
ncbi:SA1362 family protein [Sporolactobacillus vineae]|uniref:SA1362 family protein n=1 Tax=Sporolactobacillus vineae TaxID=444463 RepID=UPI000287EA99|nr:SA1362 family protein [Sporolactobacillus vineae]